MKDWENISDEELDGLFKEEADKNYLPYEESSWKAMETLLDKGGKGKGLGWLGSAIIGLVLLSAISFISYQYINKSDSINDREITNSMGNDESTPNSMESKSKGSVQEEKPTNSKNEIVQNSTEQKIAEAQHFTKEWESDANLPSSKSLNLNENQHASEFKTGSKNRIGEGRSVITKANAQQIGTRKLSDKKNREEGQRDLGSVNKTNDILTNSIEDKRSYPTIYNAADRKDKLNLSGQLVTVPFENNDISQNKTFSEDIKYLSRPQFVSLEYAKETSTAFKGVDKVNTNSSHIASLKQPKLAFRLAFSPDFSAVPSNSFFKIGHNIGGLVEYRFNDKWLIQTGVIKSLKYYTANSDSYGWPETWGQRPTELNLVEARCNMLDLPVNIRYDFSQGINRWFAQAGFTSYLMLRETYDYIYENSYSSQKWNSWEGKTGFYNAGEFNASFGLERRISKGISLQVEPFVKVPLAKVGYGNVKLITTGIFFSTTIPLVK
ncbi:MAG: PorT family protein [Cytophagales bacterium]|nr:PorT family protein [Cytophagales bacterium]